MRVNNALVHNCTPLPPPQFRPAVDAGERDGVRGRLRQSDRPTAAADAAGEVFRADSYPLF